MSNSSETDPMDMLAWSSFLGGCPSALQTELGLSVERRHGALALFASGVDSLLLNRIFDVDRLSEEQARELLADYAGRGIERLYAHAPEERLTDQSMRVLQAAGLEQYHRRWIELVRGPGPVMQTRTDLVLREAGPEHATGFAEVLSAGFDMPSSARPLCRTLIGRAGFHTFVALDGDRVVAGGTLFVADHRACLLGAATAPDYRGRGAQKALLNRRLTRAFELGCRSVSSETGEAVPGERNPSYENLIRYGFEPVGVRVNFVRPGTRW
jgi:ribosomal protein S18 acetylase RimI-like enzyme